MMQKRLSLTAKLLSVFILFLLCLPLTAYGAGMEVAADRNEVSKGENIELSVSFSGTDIWFAMVTISISGHSVEGGGKFLIEPDRGQSSVSDTYSLRAVSPGTSVITVEGYTDENESAVYRETVSVTVRDVPEDEPEVAPGRGADADPNYQDGNGDYINNNVPSSDSDASEEKASGEQMTTGPEKETPVSGKDTGKKQTAKEQTPPVILIIVIAVILVLAAGVTVFLVIRKRQTGAGEKVKHTKPEEKK